MNKEQYKRLIELRKMGYNIKEPSLQERIKEAINQNPLVRLYKFMKGGKRN